MAESRLPLRIDVKSHNEVSILTASGLLDGTTYRELRDIIITVALHEPSAVLVDVNDLSVSSESAYSVFTSARWYVSVWPDVPILLVCAHPQRRQAIARCGVARYVPVHPTDEAALEADTGGR